MIPVNFRTIRILFYPIIRALRQESQMMKVLFGSAVAERENIKSTSFHSLSLIFNVMVEKRQFEQFNSACSFLIEARENSEPDTWHNFLQAVNSAAKASTASEKDFSGRNNILDILCRQLLSSGMLKISLTRILSENQRQNSIFMLLILTYYG